jgi:hypothetical protein
VEQRSKSRSSSINLALRKNSRSLLTLAIQSTSNAKLGRNLGLNQVHQAALVLLLQAGPVSGFRSVETMLGLKEMRPKNKRPLEVTLLEGLINNLSCYAETMALRRDFITLTCLKHYATTPPIMSCMLNTTDNSRGSGGG